MRPIARALATGLLVMACTPGASPPPSSREGADLTVFAAASLASVLDEAKLAYEAANPGTTLVISTDSSAAVATQIEQGAPADVFLSADTTNPQRLVDAGLAHADSVAFAGNELSIVVPTDNPAGIRSWHDLGRGGTRIVAAGDEVPITRYATQLVSNLALLPDAPSDFASTYAGNVVSREDNVQALLAKVELGEGDAGIVYVTDAGTAEVESIDVPINANVPATYAGVVVKASDDAAAAEAFLNWLAGPEGQEVLASFGFLPPPA